MRQEESGPPAKWAAPQDVASPTTESNGGLTGEQQHALKMARELIDAGIPVFAAAPKPGQPGEYYLPKGWEKTTPDLAVLDKWRPGWALAAVGGHVADFLDVDPRNGGDASLAELIAHNHMPQSFGRQATPSSGEHYIISTTGERTSHFADGLDLVAGSAEPDAYGTHGRGFVFIAPTVRKSKDPADNGALKAYRWVDEPDMMLLQEYRSADGTVTDESIQGIIARVHAKRAEKPAPSVASADPDDPFVTASQVRAFTQEEAQQFVQRKLDTLRQARIGVIEEMANATAATLSHFVPEFWTPEQAYALLTDALSHTAYDGRSGWTVDKFVPVLDGRRPPHDNWKAVRKMEDTPAMPTEDRLAALRAKMLTPDALESRPRPKPLVYGLLNLESLTWIIGEPGSFKSFVALDIACHVASGKDWRGRKVTQGRVLYVAAEGASGMTLRMRAWRKVYGATPDLLTLPEAVQAANPRAWADLVEVCRELEPVLIVIDTQARNTVGMEENDNTAMGVFIDRLEDLKRATGACVQVVHHTGRNGGDARGASAIDGAQDTELKVIRAKPKTALAAQVSVEKQKDGEDGVSVPITLLRVALGSDPETGEELTTLTLEPFDEFASAAGVTRNEPDWRANLTANQQDVMDAMLEHSDQDGATRAQVLRWIKERRAVDGQEEMRPTSFDSAAKALKSKGLLIVNGTRYVAAEYVG